MTALIIIVYYPQTNCNLFCVSVARIYLYLCFYPLWFSCFCFVLMFCLIVLVMHSFIIVHIHCGEQNLYSNNWA